MVIDDKNAAKLYAGGIFQSKIIDGLSVIVERITMVWVFTIPG
jgi:hypothetical protein